MELEFNFGTKGDLFKIVRLGNEQIEDSNGISVYTYDNIPKNTLYFEADPSDSYNITRDSIDVYIKTGRANNSSERYEKDIKVATDPFSKLEFTNLKYFIFGNETIEENCYEDRELYNRIFPTIKSSDANDSAPGSFFKDDNGFWRRVIE